MKQFTGIEYVKIAIANAFGLDKMLFEERIEWVNGQSIDDLKAAVGVADEPAIYLGAIYALEDALAGKPSGFMVGLDACSSGIQLMGTLIGCEVTCENTGLVDPNSRADIYTKVTEVMNDELHNMGLSVSPSRSDVKQATMTHFYGSKEKPKEIFGIDTTELDTFYGSLEGVAKGAVIVMQHLLDAWQPYATEHTWTLPDGFVVRVPVMQAVDFKVEVDELDHATFTHRVFENIGQETGLSVAANIIHSVDGMVVREVNRRCNCDLSALSTAALRISMYLGGDFATTRADYSEFVSIRLADQLLTGEVDIATVSNGKLIALYEIITGILSRNKSFPVVSVHDEFKCHPNNMNELRQTYVDIFAELSDSNLLQDILAQVHGVKRYSLPKLGNVRHLIEKSNYALS